MKTTALFLAISSLVAALAAPALAAEIKAQPKAVLELFTSQGCSSCPPADKVLESLTQRSDVIALAYHVDYWDYIGWKDTFDSPANTQRQRDYAKAWGSNNIYTPQLVINGQKEMVGSRINEINGALSSASLAIPVALTADGDMLDISIAGKPGEAESAVWLVTYQDKASVPVTRGENAGHTLSYVQIVTGRHVLGMWDPKSGTHLKLPLAEVLTGKSDGAVILVQGDNHGLPGPITGAASFSR